MNTEIYLFQTRCYVGPRGYLSSWMILMQFPCFHFASSLMSINLNFTFWFEKFVSYLLQSVVWVSPVAIFFPTIFDDFLSVTFFYFLFSSQSILNVFLVTSLLPWIDSIDQDFPHLVWCCFFFLSFCVLYWRILSFHSNVDFFFFLFLNTFVYIFCHYFCEFFWISISLQLRILCILNIDEKPFEPYFFVHFSNHFLPLRGFCVFYLFFFSFSILVILFCMEAWGGEGGYIFIGCT